MREGDFEMIGNNGNSYGVWDGKCFLHNVDRHIPNHFESLGRQQRWRIYPLQLGIHDEQQKRLF